VDRFRREDKLEGVERGFYNICTRLKTMGILRSMEPEESPGQAVRSQLKQVVSSPGFSRNERLSRFLRFLVERHLEGRDSELKESLIAIEVFGRKPDYDPKLDAIVRTEAVRLRARLDRYYAGEGRADPVIIELPKGGYTPRFRQPVARVPDLRSAVGQDPGLRPVSRRIWLVVGLACLAVALAAVGWWRFQHQNAPIPIAVLPLNNLSQDPANDYFADGLTDEIIRNLSIIDGLAVRSQSSSFTFKGKPQKAREAGKQLEVDYILEGSVLRAGQQLRINAQLIRARDDFPLWSARYDRELTDVLAIQDDISRGIVNSLRLKLGRGRRRYETSIEAYDLYLRARALEIQGGLRDWNQSIGPFAEVIAKDPSFAPAYAGLAAAHAARSGQFDFDRADEMSKMRASAEKAIQLDPLLAEAHDALGLVYARDAKWDQSEKSFRRAIELNPSRAESYYHFAMFLLLPLGRIEEALRQVRVAERIDPLSPSAQDKLAFVLMAAGRYDEAASHCQKPPADYYNNNMCLGRARLGQGRIDEAIQLLATANNANSRGFLGYVYARAGRREEAEKLAGDPSLRPFPQAVIFTGLGDKDRAFGALDRAVPLGPVRMGREVMHMPEFALLRGDPRLKALRKKVGLPE
jgi:TolB-like protein/Flp pilus assembly protein TadD